MKRIDYLPYFHKRLTDTRYSSCRHNRPKLEQYRLGPYPKMSTCINRYPQANAIHLTWWLTPICYHCHQSTSKTIASYGIQITRLHAILCLHSIHHDTPSTLLMKYWQWFINCTIHMRIHKWNTYHNEQAQHLCTILTIYLKHLRLQPNLWLA